LNGAAFEEPPGINKQDADCGKHTGQTEAVVRQAFVDRQPIGRLGTPQEIAAMAVYLASDEAAYTTGAVHLVDGGFSL